MTVAQTPLARLAVYVLIFVVCGAVACHESYYALSSNTTTATVLTVGKSGSGSRTARYWADYEYFDTQEGRHVGRLEGVPPATYPGDRVEVQYLRHAPQTSRRTPSQMPGLSYGAVALLSAVVFTAEIVVRRQRRTKERP
jgi:hypothetical protein